MHIATVLTWTLSILSILLMLLRPRGIAEVYWVSGGALALTAGRLIPLQRAVYALRAGTDVYLFLIGMMVLAELAREEGVFHWIADVAAYYAKGSSSRLFFLIYLSGTVVTALLSNDATAVVLTPAVLAVVRRARVRPKPYLLACALTANAASFIFPMSNPANLIVFHGRLPPLVAWLHLFLLPAAAAVVITFVCLRFLSRAELRGKIEDSIEAVGLSSAGKLALAGLIVAAAVLMIASALGLRLGLPTCAAAAFAVTLVSWRRPKISREVLRGVSWAVVPLVAGLFVIVEALEGAGLFGLGAAWFAWLGHTAQLAAGLVAGFAAALLSNGMNNLPVGLIGGAAIRNAHVSTAIAHAILVGVDLGPNLSVSGSLATILWLLALRRENIEITAWEFLKTGVIVMPLALLGSLLVLLR